MMFGFWGKKTKDQDTGVSADFQRALMQEVMTTELLRIKALIATTALLAVILCTVYFFASEAVSRVWHGNLKPEYLYSIIVPFILFELWVHSQITRHMQQGRDLPVVRRYIGALIETSMPTVALALHINSMGSVAALGFVAPMTYFIFIILSTLRLDFWLSTFTGAVAAAQLFCMAMFYHPAVGAEAEPIYYHAARSLIVLICGVLAGAVGHQVRGEVGASVEAASADLLSRRAQPARTDLRRARRRGRAPVAAAVRGQHQGRDRARPHHQSVRPARLAPGGRAPDGGRRRDRT